MKSNETINQTQWTESEKKLAEKHGVEAKMVRLVGELIADHLKRIVDQQLRPLELLKHAYDYDQEQRSHDALSEEKLSLEDQSEEILKQWFLARSLETKLAVLIIRILETEDYGTCPLVDQIVGQYEEQVSKILKEPSADLSPELQIIVGMLSQLVIWQKHYR